MTKINHLQGYAFAKKKGDTIHVFEGPHTLADFFSVIAEGSDVPRMLKDRFADVVCVKDFGAVGDGQHDDTEAIQAALDNSSGKTVLFDGVFRLSDKGVRFRSNEKIVFTPRSKLIRGFKVGSDGSSALARIEPLPLEARVENIIFEGAVFDGNCTESDFGSIQFDVFILGTETTPCSGIFFSKCVFRDWTNAHAIDLHSASQIVFEDCRFIGMKFDEDLDTDGVSVKREAIQIEPDCSNITVSRCYFGPSDKINTSPRCGVGNHGWASNDDPNENINVEFCVFDGCAFAGVHVYVWKNSNIRNNQFLNCGECGIVLNSKRDAVAGISCVNQNITIEGNYIQGGDNCKLIYSYTHSEGDYDESVADEFYSNDIIVRNNILVDGAYAFNSNDAMHVSITNNVIKGQTTAIYVPTGGEFLVDANNFYDLSGPCLYANANLTTPSSWRTSEKHNSGWVFSNNKIFNPKARLVHFTTVHRRILICNNHSYENNDRTDSNTYYHIQYGNTNKVRAFILNNVCETKSSGRLMITGQPDEIVVSNNLYLVDKTPTDLYGVGTTLGNFEYGYLFLATHSSNSTDKKSGIYFLKGSGKESGIFAQLDSNNNSVLYLGETVSGVSCDKVSLCASGSPDVSYCDSTFYPESDAAVNLGGGNHRWNNLYASSGTINTSDSRYKLSVALASDALLDAIGAIPIHTFQFKDAIKKKGADVARFHAGVIAQEVASAFQAKGLDAARYGLFCHDTWQDEYETVEVVDQEEVVDDEGNVVTPRVTHTEQRLVTAAGDRYGIRYEELLMLECARLRREFQRVNTALIAHGITLGDE